VIKDSNKYKPCNHHHEMTDNQSVVDFGSGVFVADNERVILLKALNECGLKTRTHCYGHETGYSFVSILLNDDIDIEIKSVREGHSTREFEKNQKELLITWKRID
jgi:hypothetical protein